ncbi:MAG: OmpA family protein [Candidatus Hydrothermales bacterium]
MIKFLIFLFFDLKAFSSGLSNVGYSFPFSLLFEEDLLRPYFSINTLQYKRGIFLKDGYYSYSSGFNIDSINSLRFTLSSEFYQGKAKETDFSLLTGTKILSFLFGYLGFYGVIEDDLRLISGLRSKIQSPLYKSFFEGLIIGPGVKGFNLKFISRVFITEIKTFKNVSVQALSFSFGKFQKLQGGFATEFIIREKILPGIGVTWTEGMQPYPSIFLSYFTNFIEKTDYLLSASINFLPKNDIRYSFSFNVLIGDEKWKEKELRKKKIEMENLKRLIAESEQKFKEAQKIFEETSKLNQEIERKKREIDSLKNILEREKEEVKRLREEALEALRKIEGLKIQEEKEFIKITATEKAVHFEIGGTGLTVESILTLKKIANFLRTYPRYKVRVEGHTDNIPIGPLLKSKFKDNLELSKARAKAVCDYFILVENLSNLEFEYEGFGDKRPIASNTTEEGRAQNRRVEIIIEKK